MNMHVKKGDNVKILSGAHKGKTGKIARALPKIDRVLIDGINTVKKHERSRKQDGKGQVIEKAMPMHVSNVAKIN